MTQKPDNNEQLNNRENSKKKARENSLLFVNKIKMRLIVDYSFYCPFEDPLKMISKYIQNKKQTLFFKTMWKNTKWRLFNEWFIFTITKLRLIKPHGQT